MREVADDAPIPVRFRDARADDAERVAALHAASWRRHYRGAYADSFLDADVLTDRRAVWSARLAEPVHSVTVVAEWGSLIDNLHVAHRCQRAGVGTALLGHAAPRILERATAPRVYLWVLEQNASAQRFYRVRGGASVERAPVPPPGGEPSRLNGSPFGLRIAWPDASALAGSTRGKLG